MRKQITIFLKFVVAKSIDKFLWPSLGCAQLLKQCLKILKQRQKIVIGLRRRHVNFLRKKYSETSVTLSKTNPQETYYGQY